MNRRLHLFGRWGVLAGISAVMWAGPIKDPQMGLDEGSLSDPITGQTVVLPGAGGGGAFGFYNATGQFIIALTFQTHILLGLTPEQIATGFSCNSGDSSQTLSNPFFLNCSIDYTPSDGALSIRFFGVLHEEPTEVPGNEAGEHEGIPPLLPGCSAHPDADGCNNVGHFILTLNDGYLPQGDAGGWSPDKTPEFIPPQGVNFAVTEIATAAPEPATSALMISAFAGLYWLKRRRG